MIETLSFLFGLGFSVLVYQRSIRRASYSRGRKAAYFCICNGLLSSAGYNRDKEEPLFTVGTNASRVDRIITVKTLMDELAGMVPAPTT